MAKVNLNKITPIKKSDDITVVINEQEVTVRTYLPIVEKMALVEKVLNITIDNTGFLNPMRLEVFTLIEIVRTYTNISITDKMMEDPGKVYDSLMINGVFDAVIPAIPKDEFDGVFEAIEEAAEHVVNYNNSFVGMLRTINADYSATNMNVEKLMETLGDPDKIGLVKDILDKIG